ncbi:MULTISPECIES: tRNA (adenosine(37)-N6)-threonylcarbamoyltransferase complex dimerization subunit type 1 TsaB [Isoptericola]|uniref:tRNA (Adenosine(37)-N6)-threonylcarbamoyltransferase complex dimerization subunit type 1 TsaB n=1 Tax=Isoptericola sediminis TaxID=2733572 RepID=A0A849K129_9MICO|nr:MULTISPECIES: tRNA (adenosine(37)-N6)-threonylcarbamoyltransferase complex dimerization subunit type 1 TsaB [unclassified Isoptericola]MDO8143134.1 tRNA (adenosine(37)-N6)-threonylcarbamoyltransferase complex dimerization subunit type 1 TsaB [Isoptericola sp. 178]MDO8146995.1 tRNA (adenosine(37)-N6)-threonylcarbamoyltransferase complex dimerization subunit type 1 TsaB [Isoptericola sp. b515]MDO8150690.1 tRNA (adenosine(37)-N6)-threonylcarbamoyltransferase complex dimerization subunit type 1 T
MAVLAIDTSAAVSVAVVDDDGGRLAVRNADERRRHAESLAPLIADALAAAGLERTDLTAVVGGTGPAPFTGLRVGLVTARTLALSLGIDVLGVPSIDALAVEAVADLGLDPGDEVLVATDARRKEVYWARYRVVAHEGPHGVPVVAVERGPEVGRAADVAASQLDPPTADGARLAVVGEGAGLYPDHLVADEDAPVLPDATVLARLALARRAEGVDQPTEPLYLRRPDVQEPAGAKRATGGAA